MKSHSLSALLATLALLVGSAMAETRNYVYILTGQSNSLGAVKGSPASQEELDRYAGESQEAAQLWSGNMVRDTGSPFDQSPAWRPVRPQLPKYNGSLCMGPEVGFAHMMLRRKWHASGRLCIIKASLDGGGNTFWLADKPAFISLSRSVKNALSSLSGKTSVQALLYLQGESDSEAEIPLAPARFVDLKSRLQKVVKKGLKHAVAGECATWHGRDKADAKGNTSAKLMYALSQKKKDIGWVRTRDLTKITAGDNMGVHYDGHSQLSIGARYAYAVALLEKLPLPCVRGDQPSAPLNTPAAWWGGHLPAAADVATWDISSLRGEESLSGPLNVSGLLVEDPPAGKVLVSAGKSASASIHVGAGGIELRDGDLDLECDLVTTADQSWSLSDARTLRLTRLSGKGCITISAPASATLILQLPSAPPQAWLLPAAPPQVQATIAGKPAHFVKEGVVYKLVPQAT